MNKEVKRRRDKRIRALGGYTAEDIRYERENRGIRRNDLNVRTFGVNRIISPCCPTELIDIERVMREQLIDEVIKNYPQAIKLIWKENNVGEVTLGAKIKIVMEE